MYLPKSKYTGPKHTRGGEFALRSGAEYRGWYFEAYTGEFFTGKEPSSRSKRLRRIDVEDSTELITFTSQIVAPTKADYRKGSFIRYFAEDKRNGKVIEIGKEKSKLLATKGYIKITSVEWLLNGPADNIERNGYIYEGAASKNKKAVEIASRETKNLNLVIKDYSKFVI